jgi:hypothetical protein
VGAARATTNLMAVQELAEAKVKFAPDDIVVTETHPQGMLALKSGKDRRLHHRPQFAGRSSHERQASQTNG